MSKNHFKLFLKAIKDLKHYGGHVMVGLIWAWILREIWHEFVPHLFLLAIIGSLVIDVDHLLYSFVYGRKDKFARQIRSYLRRGQIRNLWVFYRVQHKNNTGLLTHNIFFLGFFLIVSLLCFIFDLNSAFVLFGAIVLHLLTDMVDDIWVLGYLNENWKRLKKIKTTPAVE
jgi:hypothetical protein